MCNGLNLRAIFRESDLVNGASAYECEIARNAAPEAQEFSYSGTSFCRRWFGAALRWTLLLRLGINICRIITAVIAFGTVGRVAVIGTGNENGARVSDERSKLSKSCMRLCCGKVKNLSADLRVCAGGIAGCLGIDKWPGPTR